MKIITLPNSKAYYIATVINAVWYWPKNKTHRSMEQKQNIEIHPQKYIQQFFEKYAKAIQ